MTKKQKRQVSSGAPVENSAPAAGAARVSRMSTAAEEFNPNYDHVIADLKQIGILAVTFIVVLVVLSFIV